MGDQKKSAEELLFEFHQLEKLSKIKSRTLSSKNGVFLLDKNNPYDMEWYADHTLDKAMEYAKASQAMEGLIVTAEQEKLILDVESGKISEDEFNQKARQLANE